MTRQAEPWAKPARVLCAYSPPVQTSSRHGSNAGQTGNRRELRYRPPEPDARLPRESSFQAGLVQSGARAETKPEAPVPGRFRRVGGTTAMFSEPTEIIRVEPERDPTESLLSVRFGGFDVCRHSRRVGVVRARCVPVRVDDHGRVRSLTGRTPRTRRPAVPR
jgi:hypothetical protein